MAVDVATLDGVFSLGVSSMENAVVEAADVVALAIESWMDPRLPAIRFRGRHCKERAGWRPRVAASSSWPEYSREQSQAGAEIFPLATCTTSVPIGLSEFDFVRSAGDLLIHPNKPAAGTEQKGASAR
jgi:hypothetical protein